HYTVDEKAHSVPLTEKGIEKVEEILGLEPRDFSVKQTEEPVETDSENEETVNEIDPELMEEYGLEEEDESDEDNHPLYYNENIELLHFLETALKAKELYKKDVEYVVKDGEIVIVDEFTGRLMFGRRYSDGIHQAVEAKEGVKVKSEDQTLASITFQNYFRMYEKLSGMTGTAVTEEREFRKIYNMDVVVIPTNKPCVRADTADRIYKSQKVKFQAVLNEIEEMHNLGRPVLVGTRSIEISEELSQVLKRQGIPHNVLNAKHHEKEAQIIAEAGKPGAVTIATNMAGRGVDIILGGKPPSSENEKRQYHSAKAHFDKVSFELDKIQNQRKKLVEEKKKIEQEYENLKEQVKQKEELVDGSSSDAQEKKLETLRQKSNEAFTSISEKENNILELDKRIKSQKSQLAEIQEKMNKAREELGKAEVEVKDEMKEWKQNHEKVLDAGGLAIIGTERHESRRIDNQLRGRSGRQGDPGSSRFYVSLEDELMRLFGSDRLPDWLTSFEEDVETPLEFNIFTKSIQKAQEKVESHHFDVRKTVLDYDNVMNEQRKSVYAERDRILRGEDIQDEIKEYIDNYVNKLVYLYTYVPPPNLLNEVNGNWNIAYLFFREHFTILSEDEWEVEDLYKELKDIFIPLPQGAKESDLVVADRDQLKDRMKEWAMYAYKTREEKLGSNLMRMLERWLLLQMIDSKWMDHLQVMDDLREGINLRAYGQKDPLAEYIRESFEAYKEMRQTIEEDTIKNLFRVQVRAEALERHQESKYQVTRMHRGEGHTSGSPGGDGKGTTVRTGPKVGRNQPCPCGSGKKYKKCCGRKV
ncbi:MAG: SEC-C metal-binding domain-containing protein, partial [Vulcanimicrobiota bacterium]